MSNKDIFQKKCKQHVFNFVNLCKDYRKKFGEKMLFNENNLFTSFAEKLVSEFEKTGGKDIKNKPYVFFHILIFSFLSYLDTYIVSEFKGKPDNNRTLAILLYNAIKKYGAIVGLMENQEYESGLVLFRSLYENIIILKFLLKYDGCVEPFEQYSTFKLIKLSKKGFEDTLEQIEFSDIKENFQQLKKDSGDYDWAYSIIQKDKIKFINIVDKAFEDNINLKEKMGRKYKIISDLVHSNTTALSDTLFEDILDRLLCECIRDFCIPLIKECFYTHFKSSFNNRFSFEMEVFNELFEYFIIK